MLSARLLAGWRGVPVVELFRADMLAPGMTWREL